MPLYGIIKKYLGGYVDILVFFIILLIIYFKIIELRILYSCLETLMVFYTYKIYYWIFARQFKYDYEKNKEVIKDKEEKVGLTWDFHRIVSEEFIIKHYKKIYIILCFLVMPFNIVWFILVNFAVWKKLMKVWFNGNKDIFFFKHFEYDVRKIFDRYIVFYYDYMDKYVRIFIHEPLLRIIIIPTLIRNGLIHSTYFSILKGRLFIFVFLSFLVFSGLIEYLKQPAYIWVIIIYIYFLVIWPMIIKIFNIEYIDNIFENKKIRYTTPKNIINAYLLVHENSISLNYVNLFVFYVNSINNTFLCFYINIFPIWYYLFLKTDNYNSKGLIDYLDIDRKFAGLMFWRYEKTYSSLICLNLFWEGNIDKIMLVYYLADKFYPFNFKEEEMNIVKEKYYRILKIYIFATCDSEVFFDVKVNDMIGPMFFNDWKKEKTKGEYNIYICEYVNKWSDLLKNSNLNLSEYKSIKDYIERIKIASFFLKCEIYPLNKKAYLLIKWIYLFFKEVKNECENKKEEERIIKFNKLSLENYNKAVKIFDNKELNDEFEELFINFVKEFEEEFNKNPNRFIEYEKIKEIIRILNE